MTHPLDYRIKAGPLSGRFSFAGQPRSHESVEFQQIRRLLNESKPEAAIDRLLKLLDTKPTLAHRANELVRNIGEKAYESLPDAIKAEYLWKLGHAGIRPQRAPALDFNF